jgi:hypothetical protein
MPSTRFRRRGLVVILAAALVATGGLAYAAIPDAGGVVHTCYTKSSGAWRVIDTGLGQTCKSNEAAIDLYTKGGADLAFLGKTATAANSDKLDGQDSSAFLRSGAKAADSDKLDGKDSTEFLGATEKSADADKLDGLDSSRYLRGAAGWLYSDFARLTDRGTHDVGHPAEGDYPGMSLTLTCDVDGGTRLVASSPQPFLWWWDETFGQTPSATPPHEQAFPVGDGVESHEFRSVFTFLGNTTKLDLHTSIGFDPQFGAHLCTIGSTLHKSANVSPGP